MAQNSANFYATPTDYSKIFGLLSKVFSAVHERSLRRGERDFSRHGPLCPELLTALVLYMVADGNRRGYEHLLDAFWDDARSHGLPLPTLTPVSAASFCTARPKITPSLLRHMLHEIAEHAFEDGASVPRRWHGKRVFAVDGTKINLQRSDDLHRKFGTPQGAHCPQVLVSVLLDVCAKLPMDLEVSSFTGNEREHLLAMLPSLEAGDLLVLDRGYPSHEILQDLSLAGIDFLIRVPCANTFAVIQELQDSGDTDRAFQLQPPQGSPSHWTRLDLRAVKITGPDGTACFFITSLQQGKFGLGQLAELYHMRWDVEEFFKVMKGPYIGQGQFRSKMPTGVLQEIHALILFLALNRVCMAAAADASGRDHDSLSQKAGVLGLTAHITRILLAPDEHSALRQLDLLLQRIARIRHTKRPGRSFPRRSLRPARRWAACGRRGG